MELNIRVYPNRNAPMYYQGASLHHVEGEVFMDIPEYKEFVQFYSVFLDEGWLPNSTSHWIGDFETENDALDFIQRAFNDFEESEHETI